jgi:nucleoside-diphosphate-sugar epimerase
MTIEEKQKILVAGAGGFIGSHLVERLVAKGDIVAGLSRSSGKLAEIDSKSFAFYLCDLTDAEQTRKCLQAFKPDIVLNFAAHPDSRESYNQAMQTIQNNLIGTLNLLDAFTQLGGGTFIMGDSCKVYGFEHPPYTSETKVNPNSSYAISKLAAWNLCTLYQNLYGVKVVSIRPTIVFGPRQPLNIFSAVLARLAKGETEITLDGGTQTRDPLYISDLIDLCLLVIENIDAVNGMVLNLGGGSEVAVFDLVKHIVDITKSAATVTSCPERVRKTEILRCYCDNKEIERLLGWKPKVSLQEGITRLITDTDWRNLGKTG